MAQIKPFKGLRFNTAIAGDISTLICKPYDIISDDDYKSYIDSNPYNIIRLELPKGSNKYDKALKLLKEWKIKGILKKDPEDCIYVYEHEFLHDNKIKRVKGFICLVKLEDFSKGIILPHESTLQNDKLDRLNLIKSTACNFSPVYSLYEDKNSCTKSLVDKLSNYTANVEFIDENKSIYRLWIVTDKILINELVNQFKDRRLYIADGHHRYETALSYRNYQRISRFDDQNRGSDYVMMMLSDMNSDGILVLPTHRLVKNIENFDIDKILNKLEKNFNLEKIDNISLIKSKLDDMYKIGKKAFAFYCKENSSILLTLKDDINLKNIIKNEDDSIIDLDVTVLHELILRDIFNIDTVCLKDQGSLGFTHFIEDAVRLVNNLEYQCAFIMNGTKMSQIKKAADSGCKMPQKSTYFYPKIITGLVMNELD